MGYTDEVAKIVVNWFSTVYFNSAENMGMMSDHGICPGIDCGMRQ